MGNNRDTVWALSSPRLWSCSTRTRRLPSPSESLFETRMVDISVASSSCVQLDARLTSFYSLHTPDNRSRRHQRRDNGVVDHHIGLQDCLSPSYHRCNTKFPLRSPGQERQVSSPNHCQTDGKYASNSWLQPPYHYGSTCKSDSRLLQRSCGQFICGT